MPVKLERALKRKAASKGLTGERKDAYIYGTLRKTGWKPSQEKKMSSESKIVRLSAISKRLDDLIQFQYDDDEERKGHTLRDTALVGTAGAGLYGAGLYRRGVPLSGIPKAAGQDVRNIYSAVRGGRLPTAAVSDIGSSLGAGARSVYSGAKTLGRSALGVLRKLRFNAETKEIQFMRSDDPTADMFGGYDPGIQENIKKEAEKYDALQRLRMKIGTLRAMGLNS